MNTFINEKILWAGTGALLALLIAFLLGGVYTITPPSGPVDTAYKMNRFTGKVWLIKTYAKPLAQGQVRVLTAREAEVEKTRELKDDDVESFAMNQPVPVTAGRDDLNPSTALKNSLRNLSPRLTALNPPNKLRRVDTARRNSKEDRYEYHRCRRAYRRKRQ